MSDLDVLLRKAELMRDKSPILSNAQDLFMKGHITADQYEQIVKGEQAAMSIKPSTNLSDMHMPEDYRIPSSVTEVLQKTKPTDNIVDWSKIIEESAKAIDKVLESIVPNQIDHVVIKAERVKKTQYAIPDHPHFKIYIRLLDIKKETVQTIGTNIQIPLDLCTDENDKMFWIHFNQMVVNQFEIIVLQLIRAIKTDSVDRIGQQSVTGDV